MERTKTSQNQKQLLAVRAGILGSALMIGLGIFMYAGSTPNPSELRGDILSPEQLAQADIEVLSTDSTEMTMEDLYADDSMTDTEREAMLETLLEDSAYDSGTGADIMTSSNPMDYGTDYLEDPSSSELERLRALVATQDLKKAQLRASTEEYWVMQDLASGSLHGAAPEAEMMAIGGGTSDLSLEETTPETMPNSGPEVLVLLLAGALAAVGIRSAARQ